VNHFFLDASAWIKRFHEEPGTDVVDRLVDALLAAPKRIAISPLGLAEVSAALNRHKNEGRLPSSLVQQAIARLLLEASAMDVQPLSEAIVMESLPHISKHNVNASDALYLHQVILLKNLLHRVDHDVMLVASDRRLVRAATVEGITVLDPEIAVVADVPGLIG
jgi:predicted nucleic acid-binding protein